MEKIVEDKIPFRFKVSGNLISKLGRDSISNKNVAVLELIKNSYDACATKVDVEIENLGTNATKLLIKDNGKGMTLTDIENKWLNIATPNKSLEGISECGRVLVGEKGIGRLSSDSLGSAAMIKTLPAGETHGCIIDFKWDEYEKQGVQVSDVDNFGSKFLKPKKKSGTIIEIKKLRNNWNDINERRNLLRDIYLLNPPNKKVKNFKLTTSFHKDIKDFVKIRKKVLDKATYYLKTKLVSGNNISYSFKTITGKSKNDAFRIGKKYNCGDVEFELYFFYREPKYFKAALNYDIPIQDFDSINKMLNEYFGIKLYRDGFRVKPYGEKFNDWIGLETIAQNNTMCPRNVQIFGMVHLTKANNPKIIDTTTREGVIHSEEFTDLIEFIKYSIEGIFIDRRSEIEEHKKKARKPKKKPTTTPTPIIGVAQPSTSFTKEKLIDVKGDYPQNFYVKLESEINDCYRTNLPNAAFFLCRKLVENLLFNVLEKQFPKEVDLYFDTKKNWQRTFSELIHNIHLNKRRFKPSLKPYIEKLYKIIEPFRKEANLKAHRVYEYIKNKQDLTKFHINDIVQLLVHVYKNI